jgi:hypothetical protein
MLFSALSFCSHFSFCCLLGFWTPQGDFVHLYRTVDLLSRFPQLFMLLAFAAVFGVLALSRRNVRVAFEINSDGGFGGCVYGGVFVLNAMYMNTAENSPQPSDFSAICRCGCAKLLCRLWLRGPQL